MENKNELKVSDLLDMLANVNTPLSQKTQICNLISENINNSKVLYEFMIVNVLSVCKHLNLDVGCDNINEFLQAYPNMQEGVKKIDLLFKIIRGETEAVKIIEKKQAEAQEVIDAK